MARSLVTRSRGAVLRVLALLVVFFTVALATAFSSFRVESRDMVIGAHSATVRPTFDGYATIDFGPLLPRLRLAIDQPGDLGIDITVRDTVLATGGFEELISRDALIASQPQGEIARVRGTLRAMAYDAALRGAGAGLLGALAVVGVWMLVGPTRRVHLGEVAARRVRERQVRPLLVAAGTALAVGAGAVAVMVPSTRGSERLEESWVTLDELIPQIPLEGPLAQVEVQRGAATQGGVALVESAISTYNQSVEFYGAMHERVPEVAEEFRRPEAGDTVALLIADRHDNIGMDPVLRSIADAAGVDLLVNAGDDTSSGGSWEAFSVNSLADSFEGIPVVAVAGNHDSETVVEGYRDAGFTVLDGEPVDVEGIRFLGDHDPRSSGLTATTSDGEETVEEVARRLADVACEDGGVSTVLVHSPATGLAAAESGCVDLVVNGHVHRQIGPTTFIAEDGRPTTTYSNGTTGGAAFAFALGSALRREAQVTLLTFRDGVPVGIQPLPIATDGTITVREYLELPLARPEPGIREEPQTGDEPGTGTEAGTGVADGNGRRGEG